MLKVFIQAHTYLGMHGEMICLKYVYICSKKLANLSLTSWPRFY